VLPAVPAHTALAELQVDLTQAQIGDGTWTAVIDGEGAIPECDEDDNTAVWADPVCP
jgi:hypothetical protein